MKTKIIIIAVAAGLFAFATTVHADLYSFTNITNNSTVNVASQLSVEVTEADPTHVSFRFTNIGSIGSAIADVYFDDGSLLGISAIAGSSGVSFSPNADPGNLPGGASITPPFVVGNGTMEVFSADADTPQEYANAVENGTPPTNEWLEITFLLVDGKAFSDTIAALNDGSLRIGLHVQGIEGAGADDSDSFLNVPIPVPGAALLGLLGFGLIGWIKRRFA